MVEIRQDNQTDLNLIVQMKFGAHLYGTASQDSDLDIKGVFLPTEEQVLLGNIPKSVSWSSGQPGLKNTRQDVDYEYYSLHYFIKLACEGQTVALDMLHAPGDMILKSSLVWQEMVCQRHLFYTKNLNAFIEYARRQASKYGIKGSRINAAKQVLNVLKSSDQEARLRTIWDKLPRIEHCYDIGTDPSGVRQYQVCGKTFQESAAI